MIIYYQKEIGQTMNQIIDIIKKEHQPNKITYAGRLDPLAYGLVIILTDDDIQKRDEYTNKTKTYQFNMIKGIQTDTYDILGLINNVHHDIYFDKIVKGKQLMEYPPYSSVPIKEHKKPYWYCTKNNLPVINRPTKEIDLIDFKILDYNMIKKNTLINLITDRINQITIEGNTFRQTEILDKWTTSLDMNTINNINTYEIYKMEIQVSSGGYVRHFANLLGGCAYDIRRMEYC